MGEEAVESRLNAVGQTTQEAPLLIRQEARSARQRHSSRSLRIASGSALRVGDQVFQVLELNLHAGETCE